MPLQHPYESQMWIDHPCSVLLSNEWKFGHCDDYFELRHFVVEFEVKLETSTMASLPSSKLHASLSISDARVSEHWLAQLVAACAREQACESLRGLSVPSLLAEPMISTEVHMLTSAIWPSEPMLLSRACIESSNQCWDKYLSIGTNAGINI